MNSHASAQVAQKNKTSPRWPRRHKEQGAPGCQTWDAAAGTSPTWPPASSKVATPRSLRTLAPAPPAPAADLFEQPQKASQRRVPQASTQPMGGEAHKLLYPDAGLTRLQLAWIVQQQPLPLLWIPTAGRALGSPVSSGSSQVGVRDTIHLAKGCRT